MDISINFNNYGNIYFKGDTMKKSIIFLMVLVSFQTVDATAESWRTCYLNEPCMLGDHVYSSTWDPYTDQICTINVTYPNGTQAVFDAVMDNNTLGDGFHNYSYTPTVGGFYAVEMYCTNGIDTGRLDRSFIARELEKGGTRMQTEIYMFMLTVAFLSGLYALNRKEPVTMFISALFFVLSAVESTVGITKLSAGVEYTYAYESYMWLWGGFAVVAVLLTIYFVINQEGFTPE